MKVLVTLGVFEGHEDIFDAFDADFTFKYENLNAEDVKDAEVIIGSVDLGLLDYAEKLKFIQWGMAGSDAVAEKLKGKDVVLTNGTGCFSVPMAEYMIGLILENYKHLQTYTRNQDKHYYHNEGETKTIEGANVLVLGSGDIGMTFARKISALGAKVVGIKRTPAEKPEFLEALYTNEMTDECIKNADIIAMVLPQNASTIGFMSKERLALMKDGALLVNCGRGTAINTEALIEELKSERIYAALDVYEKEPLDENSPLWDLKNCIVLPHITGNLSSPYARNYMRNLCKDNLTAYVKGGEFRNVVDFETGYKKSNSK